MIRLVIVILMFLSGAVLAHAAGEADCQQIKDPDKAIAACSLLIRDAKTPNKKLGVLHYNRGTAFHAKGDFGQAISDFSKALALSPAQHAIFFNRGTAYLADRQFDLAVKDFGRALRFEEKDVQALNNRAWAYLKWKKPEKGLEDANAALKIKPDAAYIIDTRAHIWEALGEKKKAVSDFKAALEHAPKLASAKEGLKRLGAE